MIRTSLWLALLVLPSTGCQNTRALWSKHTHQPAPYPQVSLATTPDQRMLVQYDEHCEADKTITRRAYWLTPGTFGMENHRQPRFVSFSVQDSLRPVPMLRQGEASDLSRSGLRAAVCSDQRRFDLWRDETGPLTCGLPEYRLPTHSLFDRLWKTPFTLIADVLMAVIPTAVIL